MVILFCAAAHTIIVAAETRRTLILSGPIFPIGWMYEDSGKVGGTRPEFFDKIAGHAGYNWTGKLYPAKRLMESIAQGQVDLSMLVLNPLLNKPALILTSEEPIYTENLNLYSPKGTPPVQYRSDLKGKKIVVMRGFGYGGFKTWLDDPRNNVTQFEVDTFVQAINVLVSRTQDYALLYDLNFQSVLEELERTDKKMFHLAKKLTVTNWSRVPVYFHLSRKALSDAEQVLDRLMKSFHALQAEGVLPKVETTDIPGDRP